MLLTSPPLPADSMELVQHIERAEIEKELLLYKTVATQLSKGSDAREIAQTICKYRDDGPSGVFLVVEAPSGSGKSQLPFVMAAMGIPVVHVIVSLSTQTIYQALEPQSVLIRLALEHDKFKWDTEPGQSDACDLTSLRESNDELALVRVIFHWLGVPEGGLAPSTSYTMPTLLSYRRRNPNVSVPVFFLDEVMAIKGGPQALRYARNVFRAAGLVVVLMGTDSTAANLVEATTMVSRRKDTPCEWCHVITRLPHCSKKSLSALGWTKQAQENLRCRDASWSAWVDAIRSSRHTSNPYFLRVMIETTMTCAADPVSSASSSRSNFAAIVDQILTSAVRRIRLAKPSLETLPGLRGQLCLFQNVYHFADDLVSRQGKSFLVMDTREFVSHHFAVPEMSNYSLYLGSWNEKTKTCRLVMKNMEKWVDISRFAQCRDDPWLYFLFGGGAFGGDMEPFRLDGQHLTAHTAYSAVVTSNLEQHLNIHNVVAPSRCGDALEAMGLHALIVASRYGGVGGSTWWNFVLHLATHLKCDDRSSLCDLQCDWDASADIASVHKLVGDWVVPFLGPPNSPWPTTLSNMSALCLGNVHRSQNSERLDFVVEGCSNGGLSFSGEFTNDSQAVDSETMKSILRRVPSNTPFHLVVVSQLQMTYGSISWDHSDFDHLVGANVLKVVTVDEGKRSLSLAPLFDRELVAWDECRKLVLFVEEAAFNGSENAPSRRKKRMVSPGKASTSFISSSSSGSSNGGGGEEDC